ncbi:MAG TPA: hypothetical protein VFV31_03390 [Chitinophagaceae bacterium]|nr:hypothetical protein [Chitinophagaceae bacterium]
MAKSRSQNKKSSGESTTTVNTAYFLNGTQNPVTLKIFIGDKGQSGDSVISLDNVIIGKNLKGDIEMMVGTNQELAGKVLDITTTVLDLSRETNKTEVTVSLTGGIAEREYFLNEEVKNEGDLVPYSMIFRFKKINK